MLSLIFLACEMFGVFFDCPFPQLEDTCIDGYCCVAVAVPVDGSPGICTDQQCIADPTHCLCDDGVTIPFTPWIPLPCTIQSGPPADPNVPDAGFSSVRIDHTGIDFVTHPLTMFKVKPVDLVTFSQCNLPCDIWWTPGTLKCFDPQLCDGLANPPE